MIAIRLSAPTVLVLTLATALPAWSATPADRAVSEPVAIHVIQGDDLVSPLAGSTVTTEGIVTARTPRGYFIQTPDGAGDGLPGTSQGLFVQVDGGPGQVASVGNLVRVTGTVEEYRSSDLPHQLPLTRLTAVSAQQVLATLQPLPAPVVPDPAMLAPGGDIAALEPLEGMRVRIAELVVVGAAGANIDADNQTTAVTDGYFHVVAGQYLAPADLPFRAPGLPVLDAGTPPAGKNPPRHDGNPHVLRVDSSSQPGATPLDLGLNDRLRDAVGVLGYGGARYSLLLDPVSPLVVEPGSRGEGAAFSGTGEVKLVWMDLGELFDAGDDPALSDPVPSPAAYQARLAKLATHLCTFMLNPEIIAVSGVENISVLEDLAALVETNPSTYCPEPRQYQAVLVEGSDATGLDIGFLLAGHVVDGVNPRVEVLQATTLGAGEQSPHPAGGAEPLFTRLPLQVQLRVTDETGRQADLTALNVKLRELTGADSLAAGGNGWSTEGERVMTLRARQAAFIAGWLESRQQADPDEAIAVLGGFDADAFNDGRVDVMGLITGLPAPASETWVALPSPVTTPLTNLTTLAPEYTRYNANDRGEFRALDHIVVNQALRRAFAVTTAHPRMNADFPASQRVAGGGSFTFSARDPLMARLAVANFIDADTRVEVLTRPASPRVNNVFYVSVSNLGPSAAPALELLLESTLAPEQWSLSTSWPGWTCGAIEAQAGGSRVGCANDSLLSSDGHGFEIAVPADLSLDGRTVTFSASLTGGHNDPDTSNNASTGSIAFDGRVDLNVDLLPLSGDQKVLPSESSGWVVSVERSPLNPPGPVTITVDIDAAADELTFNLGDTGVTCDAGVATGARRSRFTCSVSNDDFLQVAVFGVTFATGLGDGGRVVGITVEAQAGSPDPTPADNIASDSRRVSDDVDLVASASASPETANLASQVTMQLGVRNDVTGVARNARAEIVVDLPPAELGAVEPVTYDQTPNVWTCDAPVADGAGSRIACRAPALLEQPAFRPLNYYFTLRITPPFRPGVASYTVTAGITAGSDSDELVPADNAAQAGFTVDQTSDFAVRASTPAGPVVEPGVATFPLQFDSYGANLPRNPRARLVFNAAIPLADITVSDQFGQAVACTTESGPATTTLLCPLTMQWPWLGAAVRTNPDLASTTLTLQATAINDLVDVVPANDTATASVQVIAQADLCIGISCSTSPTPYPSKLEPDQPNTLAYDLANLGPSTARAAEAVLRTSLAPSRLTLSFNSQACTGAQDIGGGRSELRCALGDLPGNGVRRQLLVGLDTTGLVTGTVGFDLRVESNVPDTNPGNNFRFFVLPIVPVVDLSAEMTTKPAKFPAPVYFSVKLGANGPVTEVFSEVVLRIESPGANGFADLNMYGPGWQCSPEIYEPDLQQWICSRYLPITPGISERITALVPAHSFLQIGRPIRVTATHRWPANALATDRTPENDSDTGIHVVDGRSTQSVKETPELTPAHGARIRQAPARQPAQER